MAKINKETVYVACFTGHGPTDLIGEECFRTKKDAKTFLDKYIRKACTNDRGDRNPDGSFTPFEEAVKSYHKECKIIKLTIK